MINKIIKMHILLHNPLFFEKIFVTYLIYTIFILHLTKYLH